MSPIELGVGIDELERMASPTPINGAVELRIEEVDDAPVKATNRPQWRFRMVVLNRPDLPNRSVFVYAQLPWCDPSKGGEWDYLNTFTILNIMKATKLQPVKANPDPTGGDFYGLPKEAFKGATLTAVVTTVPRSDDPDLMGDKVKIIVPKQSIVQ